MADGTAKAAQENSGDVWQRLVAKRAELRRTKMDREAKREALLVVDVALALLDGNTKDEERERLMSTGLDHRIARRIVGRASVLLTEPSAPLVEAPKKKEMAKSERQKPQPRPQPDVLALVRTAAARKARLCASARIAVDDLVSIVMLDLLKNPEILTSSDAPIEATIGATVRFAALAAFAKRRRCRETSTDVVTDDGETCSLLDIIADDRAEMPGEALEMREWAAEVVPALHAKRAEILTRMKPDRYWGGKARCPATAELLTVERALACFGEHDVDEASYTKGLTYRPRMVEPQEVRAWLRSAGVAA